MLHLITGWDVTNVASDDISVINTSSNRVVDDIHVGSFPHGVAYDSSHNRVYLMINDSKTVSVINTSTNQVVATIRVGDSPWGVAYIHLITGCT